MAARRRRRLPAVRQLGSPGTPGAVCLPTAGGAKFGNVEVCLTPTQMQTLFKSQRPTEIACGARACVFEPKGARTRLVKLTVDESDVGSLLDLQKSKLVPKVYRAFKLLGTTFQPIDPTRRSRAANYTYDGASVYAIEVERLQTFEEKMAPLNAAVARYTGDGSDKDQLKRYHEDIRAQNAAVDALNDQMAKLKQELDTHHGFRWHDDHVGNIGFDKTGRMKMIDGGFSATRAPANLPQLEGRKRRR